MIILKILQNKIIELKKTSICKMFLIKVYS